MQIRQQRKCAKGYETPGQCLFCGNKLEASFSVINMAEGTVSRVTEETEYTKDGERRKLLPELMERHKNLKPGQSMTDKADFMIFAYRACDRAIRLMDEVDAENAAAKFRAESKPKIQQTQPSKGNWYDGM